ncbi:hypothetical protein [Streptomyces sp. NPDC001070]
MPTAPSAPPPQPYRWALTHARGGAPPDRLGILTEGADRPRLWYQPWHGPDLPAALAESLALVEAGRGRGVREALIRVIGAEPGFADREVRALVAPLRRRRSQVRKRCR